MCSLQRFLRRSMYELRMCTNILGCIYKGFQRIAGCNWRNLHFWILDTYPHQVPNCCSSTWTCVFLWIRWYMESILGRRFPPWHFRTVSVQSHFPLDRTYRTAVYSNTSATAQNADHPEFFWCDPSHPTAELSPFFNNLHLLDLLQLHLPAPLHLEHLVPSQQADWGKRSYDLGKIQQPR